MTPFLGVSTIKDPKKIFPRKNIAVVFCGNRAFHGVIPANKNLESPELRYALQFVFDSDHNNYSNQEYCGKKLLSLE